MMYFHRLHPASLLKVCLEAQVWLHCNLQNYFVPIASANSVGGHIGHMLLISCSHQKARAALPSDQMHVCMSCGATTEDCPWKFVSWVVWNCNFEIFKALRSKCTKGLFLTCSSILWEVTSAEHAGGESLSCACPSALNQGTALNHCVRSKAVER